MAKFQPKICKECGKEFIPRTGVQTFCDREHYRPCPVCGVEVLNTRLYEPAKCCSRKCSKEYTKIKNLQKYGTEHPMQNESVKGHFKQAMMDKYGVESPLQSDEIKQRAIQTNQEKFGTDWALGNEHVHSKAQETMTERYGAKTTLESKELSEKVHDTIVAKYGVDNMMQSDEVQKKSAQTMIERYGVENPAQSPELKAKAVATRIEKYGHHKFNNILANMKSDYIVTDTAHEVSEYSRMLTEYNVVHDTYYKLDSEIYDICIPDKDLLLCINSTTEVMTTDKSCHRSKTKIATDNGYRCIHVFDWDDREGILNLVKDKQKVYARDCSIHEVTSSPT